MRKSNFKAPTIVLIFNSARVLVAIMRSVHCVAELTHNNLQSISHCCTGRYTHSRGYYFRHLHPDVLIDLDDLDNLRLEEYDKLCGTKRKYLPVRVMAHHRQKAENNYQMKVSIAKETISNNKIVDGE